MFTKQNYFLKVQFSWEDIRPVLSFADDVWAKSEKNKDYSVSFNANSWTPVADSQQVNFEYYIIPSQQAIYCQQTHRFFETPNIIYSGVLHGKDGEEVFSANLGFHSNFVSGKAAFQINYSKGDEFANRPSIQKTLVVLFDRAYLNLNFNSSMEYEKLPYEIYLIERTGEYPDKDNTITEVAFDKEKLWLQIGSQSEQDAQSAPYSGEMHSYFKKKKEQ
jgi:hypothetical protein